MTDTHAATTDNPSPTAGELQAQLTAYDSIELIAVGGMGAVYKARQISLDRPVAIKVLTHACSTSPQFRQIFKSEAQVMAKLNHPNLASIYDYGEINGMLYIVMQFVEGRSLHEAANGQAVTQKEAASLISNISNALGHAHHSGILHRDIKPANILIDSKLTPVVVDFGLAHHAQESTMQGETVFGTPGYTAPEVLAPPYSADQRADVFSLGVLFHELLTGQLPQTPYIPPSRLAPVDQRYDTVVMRAIHPSPDMRYTSAEALAEDIDCILAGKGLAPSPLLLTPATHPELAAPAQPVVVPATYSTPAANPIQCPSAITPLADNANQVAHPPAHPGTVAPTPPITPILPSLNNQSSSNAKSIVIALVACITLALIATALVVSSKKDNQPPVATGGLPSTSSPNSASGGR